jgi:hypothetical protein
MKMRDTDLDLYRTGLTEELERSLTAHDEAARQAHLALAELYRTRLAEPPPPPYRPSVPRSWKA